MSNPSKSALLAKIVALGSLLVAMLGVGLAKVGLVSPENGFGLFAGGLGPGAVLSILLGLFALWRTGRKVGKSGRRNAVAGLLIGLFLLGLLLGKVASTPSTAPIHDITTNPLDPPMFDLLARHPDNLDRDLAYPHGAENTAQLQAEHYPEVGPIELELPPGAAFERALEAVESLGWTVAQADPERGLIEATEQSGWFRFVDDVVIRIRPANELDPEPGSVVDLRSTSRVGVSDLGANAARIRAFAEQLRDAG